MPVVLVALLLVGLAVRVPMLGQQSGDYRAFLLPWYSHLVDAGGFAGLADSFSNYNTPYLALLALLTYLPVGPLVGIKAISIVFDVVLAAFAYGIVRRVRPDARWLPTVAFGATFLLPTVLLNGAWWAQCDSLYASLCLGSLHFLLRRRTALACAFFGLAFAFKLQAVFFLPALLVLLVVDRQRLRGLVLAPLAFVAALVPAWLAGRSLLSQLSVYPQQVANPSGAGGSGVARSGSGGFRGAPGGVPGRGGFGQGGFGQGGPGRGGGGGGGSETAHSFTHNAPTWYAWLPGDAAATWKWVGLAVAAAVALAFAVWLVARRRRLAPAEMLLVAATLSLVVPLLLPEMHERYFFLGEVMAVVAVFVDRRFLVVAGLMQVATLSTYWTYLERQTVLPLEAAAVVALAAAATATVVLVLRLRAATGRVEEERQTVAA
ncbi:Protein of unknown function [Microlunatus flavus]|uniref:Mannosyltransferase related to Gpi18 n=1 Tax=Microlunatus flavus TaxID=1036181 RepID=A0A1H9LNF3_9ACTN|nr:Protein of unknown function [Microlunatus flavus]